MSAPELRMEWERVDAARASVASHERTWARLTIRVGDVCVTRAEDLTTRSLRDSIRLPLMPLAEWIVASWWHLERESPHAYPVAAAREAGLERRDWYRRHNLLFAREGFPLPDLTIARASDEHLLVKCARDPRRMGRYPVRFAEECDVLVSRTQASEQLRALVATVVEWLDGCEAEDADELRRDWAALNSLTGDDRLLRACAAALGLDGDDPDQVSDEAAAQLVDGVSELPDEIVDDLLEVPLALDTVPAQVAWVQRARARARSVAAPASVDLTGARRVTAPIRAGAPNVPAYRTGWDLAACVRKDVFALGATAHGDAVDAKLDRWLRRVVADGDGEDIRGWVGANGSLVATLSASDTATARWLGARALCMALLGRRERLVTNAQSWSQSVCRAFATELLAPAEYLREHVRSGIIGEDELPPR